MQINNNQTNLYNPNFKAMLKVSVPKGMEADMGEIVPILETTGGKILQIIKGNSPFEQRIEKYFYAKAAKQNIAAEWVKLNAANRGILTNQNNVYNFIIGADDIEKVAKYTKKRTSRYKINYFMELAKDMFKNFGINKTKAVANTVKKENNKFDMFFKKNNGKDVDFEEPFKLLETIYDEINRFN